MNLNADGGFTYIPGRQFLRHRLVHYYANDGTTDGNPSFVNITVTEDLPNAAPVANYDSFATDVDTPVRSTRNSCWPTTSTPRATR